MANVFISYSRKDMQLIDRLVRQLAAASVETWLDRNDIRGGDKWRGTIVRAIKAADAVLVALSPDAVASDNVRRELDIAEQADKPLLPVEIRPTTLSDDLTYQLIGLQTINLAADFDAGVGELLESLRLLPKSSLAYWRPSASTRNELKALSDDSSLSMSDRLALANMKLQQEIGRALEHRLRELIELDARAAKRARLRDTRRQDGKTVESAILAAEEVQDDQKREELSRQVAQLREARQLALTQLRVLYGIPAWPRLNPFEAIEIRWTWDSSDSRLAGRPGIADWALPRPRGLHKCRTGLPKARRIVKLKMRGGLSACACSPILHQLAKHPAAR